MATQSVQPFLQGSQSLQTLGTDVPRCGLITHMSHWEWCWWACIKIQHHPPKVPLPVWGSGPHLRRSSLGPHPKLHLNQFSHSCRAHSHYRHWGPADRQTNRQTMLLLSVAISHIQLMPRCGLIIHTPKRKFTAQCICTHMYCAVYVMAWWWCMSLSLTSQCFIEPNE